MCFAKLKTKAAPEGCRLGKADRGWHRRKHGLLSRGMEQQSPEELQDREVKHCHGGHMTFCVKTKQNKPHQPVHCTGYGPAVGCTPANDNALVLAERL